MRKIKLLLVTLLFIVACYFIYNMKDEVEMVKPEEEMVTNEKVVVKKKNLDSDNSEYYYVEFDFSKNKAILYKSLYTEDEVRDGEVAISIYKQRDLFLNETELENYNKKLDKIYNNPYRYSYLKNSDAKDIDKDSDEYYEIEFDDIKYFIYENDERKLFDILFE